MANIDISKTGSEAPKVPQGSQVVDEKALASITGDREAALAPAVANMGMVSADASARQVRLPLFKVRQPMSTAKDPNLPMGAASLDLEIPTADKEGNTRMVVLSYWQGYENVRPQGSNLPATLFNTVDDVRKAGLTLAYPPRGCDDIKAQNPQAATARECGRAVVLVQQPEGMQSMAFPFEIDGKKYALCRWFLTGHQVWVCGNTIIDKSALELSSCGLVAARWIFRTFATMNKANQPFHKPQFYLDRTGVNSAAFIKAATDLFNINKHVADDTSDAE